MKQKEVFTKIGGIIQELNEQYVYLNSVAEDMNDLELELFVSNAHFLTDHIEILCKLNLQNSKGKRHLFDNPDSSSRKFFEPVVQQMNRSKDYKELKALRDSSLPRPVNKPIPIEVSGSEPVAAPADDQLSVDPDQIALPFEPEPPKPAETETVAHEPAAKAEPAARVEEPETKAEPVAEDIIAADKPVVTFDFSSGTSSDSYSFIRQEPEVTKPELALNEAGNAEEADHAPTVKDALAAIEAEQKETPATEPTPIPEAPAATAEPAIVTEPAAKVEPIAVANAAPVVEATVHPAPVAEEPVVKQEETWPVIKEQQLPTVIPEDEEVLTINQKISRAAAKTEAIKPINDIKLAITLNDKLLYVKDLFNGYNLAYSEAVEILNRFSSFEEAQRFLRANYVTKNNWEAKPATTEKFYALLKRRYA